MTCRILVTTLFVLLLQSPLQAEIYKWVDANGTVSFRDTPPPEGIEATVVNMAPLNVADTPAGAASQPTKAVAQPTGQSRAGVELYTTSWCRYCRQARDFLSRNGIAFREYDVEKDPAAARRLEQLGVGSGVPVAVINGRTIRGFSPGTYAAALGLP